MIKTERRAAGEHILSEANGYFSREQIVVGASQTLKAGSVLGKITATSRYVAVNPAAVDGSENAAGVLFDAVTTGVGETADAVAHVRATELDEELLDFGALTAPQIAAAKTQLRALGLIPRS